MNGRGPLVSDPAILPRFALTAEEAARSVGISVSTLENLVREGVIPKPFPIPGHAKLVRYDPDELRAAVKDWKERANLAPDGGWDNVR